MDRLFGLCCGSWGLTLLRHVAAVSLPWTSLGTVTLRGRQLVLLKQIGEGGYSFVFQAVEPASGSEYALKKVLIAGPDQLELAKREVTVMRSLQHPNLLPLLESSVVSLDDPERPASQALYLLFPLYSYGTLFAEVTRRAAQGRSLGSEEIILVFMQVCRGVEAMHSRQIPLAHRDIKPHNVLLGENKGHDMHEDEAMPLQQEMDQRSSFHAVLMDFGSTREARVTISSRAEAIQLQEDAEAHCSAPYRAPELFDVASHCSVDERVDVWSLGCLLYFMMHAASPFERVLGEAGGSLALAVQNGTVRWPARDAFWPGLRSVAAACLIVDPARRPSVMDVLARAETLLREHRG